MPTNPTVLERFFFRLQKAPAPILDLFGAATFRGVSYAIDAGVFEALGERPATADELASRLDLAPVSVERLLSLLEATGYVTRDGDAYRNTKTTRTWLTPDGMADLSPWFSFWDELVFPYWDDHLDETMRRGEPPETLYENLGDDEERWAVAQDGFAAAASLVAEAVVDAADVSSDAATVLDMGGGHGKYSLEICRRYDESTATVVDAPGALEAARETFADAGLSDRLETRGGDYLEDELGTGYDVALAFNVLHGHDAATNRRLLGRAADALNDGGRIAVFDQFDGSTRLSTGQTALGVIGLAYLVTLGQTIHDPDDVETWLRDAGFVDVEQTALRRGGAGSVVVTARKADR